MIWFPFSHTFLRFPGFPRISRGFHFPQALALMLEEGPPGVPQDTATALRWHLAAAEQGNALLLELGTGGRNAGALPSGQLPQFAMENHPFFYGSISYFDWAMFNSW